MIDLYFVILGRTLHWFWLQCRNGFKTTKMSSSHKHHFIGAWKTDKFLWKLTVRTENRRWKYCKVKAELKLELVLKMLELFYIIIFASFTFCRLFIFPHCLSLKWKTWSSFLDFVQLNDPFVTLFCLVWNHKICICLSDAW